MKHLSPDQLSAFLDNELQGKPLEEAQSHLASCEDCREELARLAALEKLTQEAEPAPADETYFETFSSRVMAGIAREKPVPIRDSLRDWFRKLNAVPVLRPQWLGGLALAALVIGFGIYLYERPELVKTPFKAPPQSGVAKKNLEVPGPVATNAPVVSGGRKAPFSEARRGEAATTQRELEGMVRKPVEAQGPGSLVVTAQRPAVEKSATTTTRLEDKGKKFEVPKARPEGPYAAPEAGAVGSAAPPTDSLSGMAAPSLRAQAREKQTADEALFDQARIKQSNQDFKDAAKDYERLVRDYPKSPYYDDARYNLALAEFTHSQQTLRIEDLRRALTVSRTFLKAARDSSRKAQVNLQIEVLEKQLRELK